MGDIKEQLEESACKLASCLDRYLDDGIAEADVCQVKEAADAIKDLAEAKYYCVVTEAMEEGSEEAYGYRPNSRVPMNWNDIYGYTPSGRGNRSQGGHGAPGMMGFKPMVDQEPYVYDYIQDPNRFKSEYGKEYDMYKDAKRHYTETHSAEDKKEMDEHMRNHVNNLLATLREMYKDADISTKQEMKSDVKAIYDGMM